LLSEDVANEDAIGIGGKIVGEFNLVKEGVNGF
jgi:hypothetical protein